MAGLERTRSRPALLDVIEYLECRRERRRVFFLHNCAPRWRRLPPTRRANSWPQLLSVADWASRLLNGTTKDFEELSIDPQTDLKCCCLAKHPTKRGISWSFARYAKGVSNEFARPATPALQSLTSVRGGNPSARRVAPKAEPIPLRRTPCNQPPWKKDNFC